MTGLCEQDEITSATSAWVQTIEDRFAIQIDPVRQESFQRALDFFAAGRGMTVEDVLAQAESDELDADAWAAVLHMATNHETRFFRYEPSVEAIVAHCRLKHTPKILSVGCSTGEEPYTIATAMLRAGCAMFHIHGTDVSPACIDIARMGQYEPHSKLGPDVVAALNTGKVSFHSWIRSMVTFQMHNILVDKPIELQRPDVIITQNMLIYYRTETRHEILDRLSRELPINGILIVGLAEDAGWRNDSMKRITNSQVTIFERVALN